MPFLFECLPFDLTFNILFRHGGFDALEAVLGRHACWEFLKFMENNNNQASPRAELLCICRTVQLLDHPAHALFLLNYPPDSSIPENRRAWEVAVKCCIGWNPDVRSVVLAMRAFISTRQYARDVFPWIDTVDLEWLRKKPEAEWKEIGRMQNLYCKFDHWWWNSQREAFQLERVAAGSDMWVVIKNTAKAEMERLNGAIRRREAMKILQVKERNAWERMQVKEVDEKIRENNIKLGSVKDHGMSYKTQGVEKSTKTTSKKPVLSFEDKKKLVDKSKAKRDSLDAVLKAVAQVLSVSPHLFEPKIDRIAGLIVSLEKKNPLIKWNLRLLFHHAANETGVTTWSIEFLVNRFHRLVAEENALEKIKGVFTAV